MALLGKPPGTKKTDPDVEAWIDRCEKDKEVLARKDAAALIASEATERLLTDAISGLAGLESEGGLSRNLRGGG